MKKVVTAIAICVAVALVALPLSYGQDKGAPPAGGQEKGAPGGGGQDRGAPGGGGQEKGGAQAERVFQGELTKVDATAKTITVKGAGNMEMTFDYTDATQVTGSERTVQGLSGKTGADLRVTYRDAGGKHQATKIEVPERTGNEKGAEKGGAEKGRPDRGDDRK